MIFFMESYFYKEIQRFKSFWIWVLLIVPMLIPIILFANELILYITNPGLINNDYESFREILIGGIVVFIACGGSILLFVSMKLEIYVKSDGLYYRFFPFNIKFKKINNDQLKNFEIRIYNPIKEYGGWGIKMTTKKKGWAYTMSGKIGLQLYLKDGRNILVGTQKPEILKSALNSIFPNKQLINN